MVEAVLRPLVPALGNIRPNAGFRGSLWSQFKSRFMKLMIWKKCKRQWTQAFRYKPKYLSLPVFCCKSVVRLFVRSFIQTFSQSLSQSVSQSVSPSVRGSVSQSVGPSVRRSVSQSVSQSDGQSVSQLDTDRQADGQSFCHLFIQSVIHSFSPGLIS